MEENELIHQLKEQRETAFRYLVESHQIRVYNTVLNILQDTEEADDTAQEVFIQVYHSIGQFKANCSLATWLYRIAVRKALDKLRQRKNRLRLRQFLPWWMPNDELKHQEFSHPGVALEQKEKANALFKAIAKLPENQKIAFTLVKVQSLKYDEASEIMQLSVKAIESLITRAKHNLQKQLIQYKNN